MKISKLEFENFRNFKERGSITCSTDGKVTIVYGRNGDGKTTLHQLFQWIFYKRVHFNKTASDKMYNLEYEKEQAYNTTFSVLGSIDFEHNGELYSVRREWIYKKGLDDSKYDNEHFSLNKKDSDNNWNRLSNPTEVIEELLPSGLSEYFFFDGESMIADLRVKGRDSASKLRQALFSIFDLTMLEKAIEHLGRTDLKTTVLGQLYLSKANVRSDTNTNVIKTNIEGAQAKITSLEEDLDKAKEEISEKREFVQSISEQIGSAKSQDEYERTRKQYQTQRDMFLDNAAKAQTDFGDEIIATYPKMLISKAITEAQKKISEKIDQTHLMPGVKKPLIDALLDPENHNCVCGRLLYDEQIEHLKAFYKFLPPLSYKDSYDTFTKTAKMWGKEYERKKIERFIKQVLENREQATKCDAEIHKIDEEKKKNADIQQLIVDRQIAEARISDLIDSNSKLETEVSKYNLYLKKQMRDFDEVTSKTGENEKINLKIKIMQDVKLYFEEELKDASLKYSQKFKAEIQNLLDKMLTSKRSVSVSQDFTISVYDSYGDESKSEGQFAVVSFAYIGGIFKLLKEEQALKAKEYPLVLDGPFSKLGDDHRQNVINTIPDYAPQMIIFTKDDIQDNFGADKIGSIWTIESNEEKNVATVKEGYRW